MWSCRCCPTPGRSNCTLTPAASSTSDGPTPLNISTCGLPIEPPARTTSLLTVTVWRAADADAAGRWPGALALDRDMRDAAAAAAAEADEADAEEETEADWALGACGRGWRGKARECGGRRDSTIERRVSQSSDVQPSTERTDSFGHTHVCDTGGVAKFWRCARHFRQICGEY